MSVQVKDYTPAVRAKVKARAGVAVRQILGEIRAVAEPKTPFKTGALRSGVIIQVLGTKGAIAWREFYAPFQERGYSSGPIRQYTTGGTGAHFAKNAIQKVVTLSNFRSKLV